MKYLVIILLAVIISCDKTPTEPGYEYKVEYAITGTAKTVDVTLNNSGGNTEQFSEVTVPQSYKYETFNDDFLYISAQNQGETGTVIVTIYYEDNPIETANSEGAYVIASASCSKP